MDGWVRVKIGEKCEKGWEICAKGVVGANPWVWGRREHVGRRTLEMGHSDTIAPVKSISDP